MTLPRESYHRRFRREGMPGKRRGTPGQGAFWAVQEAIDFDDGEIMWGIYPQGFLTWLRKVLRTDEILHVCSGTIGGRLTVDIRRRMRPAIVADGRALPLRDGCVQAVALDPPYSPRHADELYQTGYPKPKHLLEEAARVVRPGGRISMLHFHVPLPPPGCSIERVWGVTQGCGYNIRALTVYQKEQEGLFSVAVQEE